MALVLPWSARTFLSGGQVSPNEGGCMSFINNTYKIKNSTVKDTTQQIKF